MAAAAGELRRSLWLFTHRREERGRSREQRKLSWQVIYAPCAFLPPDRSSPPMPAGPHWRLCFFFSVSDALGFKRVAGQPRCVAWSVRGSGIYSSAAAWGKITSLGTPPIAGYVSASPLHKENGRDVWNSPTDRCRWNGGKLLSSAWICLLAR